MARNLPKQLQDGLVLWLDGNGKDLSGNGNNATLVNSPAKVRRLQNDGLQYNGSNTRVDFGTITNSSTDFSISLWLNYGTVSEDKKAFHMYDGTNQWTAAHDNATSKFGITTFNGSSATVFSASSINNNTWRHVVITKTGTTGNVFVDGVLSNTGTVKNVPLLGGTKTALGYERNSSVQFWNGYILNPMIWSRTLSTKEIEILRYATFIK